MNKSFSAIRYSKNMKIENILKSEGDTINVFVPVEHFILDNPVFTQQMVYGSRPYSIKSDLVAILAHMGILFPGEKPKKNSPDVLRTSPSAPLFGKQDSINLEDTRKIEDDFRFYGVVVAVTAVEPIEHYPAMPGFGVASQALHDSTFIAIDILDYSFISEFEPMPTLVDDPDSIVRHFSKADFFLPADEENLFTYEYSPDLFSCDKEGYLFKDYKVSFYMNDISLQFKWTRNQLVLIRKIISEENKISDETAILTNIQYKDIKFNETSITIGKNNYGPISRVTLENQDHYGTE